jgi:hypothetical protein
MNGQMVIADSTMQWMSMHDDGQSNVRPIGQSGRERFMPGDVPRSQGRRRCHRGLNIARRCGDSGRASDVEAVRACVRQSPATSIRVPLAGDLGVLGLRVRPYSGMHGRTGMRPWPRGTAWSARRPVHGSGGAWPERCNGIGQEFT